MHTYTCTQYFQFIFSRDVRCQGNSMCGRIIFLWNGTGSTGTLFGGKKQLRFLLHTVCKNLLKTDHIIQLKPYNMK